MTPEKIQEFRERVSIFSDTKEVVEMLENMARRSKYPNRYVLLESISSLEGLWELVLAIMEEEQPGFTEEFLKEQEE